MDDPVDVTDADCRNCGTCGGEGDRRAQNRACLSLVMSGPEAPVTFTGPCFPAPLGELRIHNLQVADGTDVVRAVHQVTPSARVVVITGQPESTPVVQETLKEGVDEVYYKPLDVPRLLEALDRLARQ